MSQIQKRLNELQPYVVGVRYVQSHSVVDVVFKEGWSIPESKIIVKEQSVEDPNYHLFYSERDDIGFDELLTYVEEIIKINIEREVKQELLKVKVKELQNLFKENTLDKLKTLKFVLGKEQLVPDLMNDEIIVEIPLIEPIVEIPTKPETNSAEPNAQTKAVVNTETNPSITHNARSKKPGIGEIELPPKGEKVILEDYSLSKEITEGDCNCGENEACPKCMDRKGF